MVKFHRTFYPVFYVWCANLLMAAILSLIGLLAKVQWIAYFGAVEALIAAVAILYLVKVNFPLRRKSIDKAEWLRRYQAEFKRDTKLTDEEAKAHAETTSYEDAIQGFEDDPEGAAQMEMSYWDV